MVMCLVFIEKKKELEVFSRCRISALTCLTVVALTLAPKHHHGDAHERTEENGKKRNEGSCFDISRCPEHGGTADADKNEADAEFGGAAHRESGTDPRKEEEKNRKADGHEDRREVRNPVFLERMESFQQK